MTTPSITYHVGRSERGMFFEIYFPHKAAYQGAIFDALGLGYDPSVVKTYLKDNAAPLLEQLGTYSRFLDPDYYDGTRKKRGQISLEEAYRRIDMYNPHFTVGRCTR